MRGKDIPRIKDKSGAGITPAYAGKSPPLYFLFSRSWDHPRLCGEKGFRAFP